MLACLKVTAVLLLGAALRGDAALERSGVSPVGKIVEMLNEMKGKTQSDIDGEKKAFEEFMNFCDDEAKDKDYALKDTAREIQDLQADIEKADGEALSASSEITEFGEVISSKEKELADAEKLRLEGKANFQATEAELMKSVDELGNAVTMVQKKGASFLQADSSDMMNKVASALSQVVDSAVLAAPQRAKVSSFLEDGMEGAGADGVMHVLEDTRDKADGQLEEVRKGETEAQHAFELTKQGLLNEIKLQKESLAEAANKKKENEEASSVAAGSLVDAKKSKAADSKYLATLRQDCQQKAVEYEQFMRSATGEIGAIDKAIEILTTKVKASSFIQVSARTHTHRSSMKVRMHRAIHDPFANDDDDDDDDDDDESDGGSDSLAQAQARIKVVDRLHSLGKKYHSVVLAQIANRAKADPMEKVKGLIEEMIAKLMQEANEEATQKAFCDGEIGKSTATKEEKGSKLAKVVSRLDEATSNKNELADQVKKLSAEIAEIDKAQSEATKIRSDEKAEFDKSYKDFKSSEEACAEAVAVLKNYYDNAAFLQVKSSTRREGSELESASGGAEAGAQIIEFLMFAEEDFAKQLAEVQTEEAKDKAAFDKLTQENKLAKATKQMEMKGKESEIKSLSVSINDHTEDKGSLEKELAAVDMYLEKLKPQCETKTMTPEERMAARKAEIEGLKDALGVLEGGV